LFASCEQQAALRKAASVGAGAGVHVELQSNIASQTQPQMQVQAKAKARARLVPIKTSDEAAAAEEPTEEAAVAPCRNAFLWPFAADSVWNTAIGSAAVYKPVHIYNESAPSLRGPPVSFHNDQDWIIMLQSSDPLTPWPTTRGSFLGCVRPSRARAGCRRRLCASRQSLPQTAAAITTPRRCCCRTTGRYCSTSRCTARTRARRSFLGTTPARRRCVLNGCLRLLNGLVCLLNDCVRFLNGCLRLLNRCFCLLTCLGYHAGAPQDFPWEIDITRKLARDPAGGRDHSGHCYYCRCQDQGGAHGLRWVCSR